MSLFDEDDCYPIKAKIPVAKPESSDGWLAQKKRQRSELSVRIHPEHCKRVLGITALNGVVIRQNADEHVYFNSDESRQFAVLEYVWNGPQYRPVTVTNTQGTTKGKTKRTGRVTGAVLGSIIAPGAGTIIGGLVGTGNKKTREKMNSTSVTTTSMEEIAVPAYMTLEDVNTGEKIRLDFSCDSGVNKVLSQFHVRRKLPPKPPVRRASADPYEELKKLKELLDMGIISQEEFDRKKSDLLGI